jgi:beta-lactamase superfamily II metal-dependent hydrolase
MRANQELKLHFINVNHGDATIIEFPDYGNPRAHFAVVDFGAKLGEDRSLTKDYMKALVDFRQDNDSDFDYLIDFICVTHPHSDHYGGLSHFLDEFADPGTAGKNKIRNFWDCGFWTTSIKYNRALDRIRENVNLTFTRVAAGSEFEFGDTRITVLAPSVDLRNRFDTFGIDMNNASIVLKIKYRNSYIILAGDAEFASWGKATEEFPRIKRINFIQDALGLSERDERVEQLGCNLLRISHHGSKHGTSLEYLERINPSYVVISAGSQNWYANNASDWQGYFPHPLVLDTLNVLNPQINPYLTGRDGNLIFKYGGGWSPRHIASFSQKPGGANFMNALSQSWT